MQIFSKNVNSLLVDLEKSNGEFWNIPREVGQLLYFLVRSSEVSKILEIGTSNGYSGIWLAQALIDNKIPGSMLMTVESHKERYAMAEENFQKAEVDKVVRQVMGHAPEVFETDEGIKAGGFDLIFLDATKKQHLEFLKQGYQLLKPGGLIIADNVTSHWEVMQHFVDAAEAMPDLKGEVLAVGDGLYIGAKSL